MSTSPAPSHDPEHLPRPYRYHRPQVLDPDLFLSHEDVHALPSPPYRRVPSTSQVLLNPYPEESPAYRSTTQLSELDMSSNLDEEKRQHDHPSKGKHAVVHYPDDVHQDSLPPGPHRFDSDIIPPASRASSIAGTDDEDDENDYDWSAEEDLVDEEANFEHAMGVTKKRRFGCTRLITLLFSTLLGSTILSGLIVTPALLVHFFWYKPHPTEHRQFVKDNVEAWLFWAAANVSISWGLALIVDIIPAIVRFVISVAWGHVSEVIKTRLELYNSVKEPIKPVLYAASCWVSWVIIFVNIFELYDMNNENMSKASYTPRVYEAIEFLFFFALVICSQRMLLHFIAFSFHRTAYQDRLQQVHEALWAVEKLRTYRPKRRHGQRSYGPRTGFGTWNILTPAFDKDAYFSRGRSRSGTPGASRAATPELGGHSSDEDRDNDATLVVKKGKSPRMSWFSHPRGGSEATDNDNNKSDDQMANTPEHRYPPSPLVPSPATTNSPTTRGPRRSDDEDDDADPAVVMQAATQAAKALKSAILHDARNIQGKGDEDLNGLVWNVSSSHEAKRLAKSIWSALKEPGRSYLIPRDFYPAFSRPADAERAFKVFDKDNNGDISRAEVKTTLLKVYKERRFLSRSMRDVGQALTTLDNMLLFLALVILFFISLSVFGVNIANSLTSLYTIGIGASFIFKNSASNAFDAITFLFVTHPFDTGDRCFIDDENLVVKKMGLFATTFTRADGTETYYFNSQLFNKFIMNLRRSDKMAENLVMQVAWRTPIEKLDQLEKCLNHWLQTEENRWYQPSTSITLQHIDYQRHLEITIGIPYNSNWQDWGLQMVRKTAFHAAVNYYCKRLGVVAYKSPIPLAFADRDTLEVIPPAEDEYEPAESPSPVPGATGREEFREREKTSVLGFNPPREDGIPSGMRPRKAKSRKAMFRAFGGGEGF